MKSVVKFKVAFLLGLNLSLLGDVAYAATAPARNSVLKVSSYLGVVMGHQAQQKIFLSHRKNKSADVYVVSYANDDRAFERSIPQSLYVQTLRDFDVIEKGLVRSGTLMNTSCSAPVEITREKNSYVLCRDLVGRKNLKAIDKWFFANKDLALGNLEDFR